MTCIRSEIIGHGHYQPAKVLTNDDMAKIVETSDEWITERTGIKSRHIAADGELTSDLALHAAEMALKNAGIGAEELDLVVIGTVTPDNTFPAVVWDRLKRLWLLVPKPCPALPTGRIAIPAFCSEMAPEPLLSAPMRVKETLLTAAS